MDITSVALLAMFGSAFVGGLLGLAIGKFTRFEIGTAVGMLVFGGVTLWFAWQCYAQYREFATAGTNGVWGEVVRIVDKPSNASGTITSPAPIVKIDVPGRGEIFIEGPTASGAKVGEHVNVILDAADPARSRVGRMSDLRGGAIAFLLFGTFPVSFAVLMIAQVLGDRQQGGGTSRPAGAADRSPRSGRLTGTRKSAYVERRGPVSTIPTRLLFAALFFAIVWTSAGGAPLLDRFTQGFAGIAACLAGYAVWGAYGARLGITWTVGLLMLALNFGVWAFALDLLR